VKISPKMYFTGVQLHSRNAARIVHIPFFKGDLPKDQRQREERFRRAINKASSGISSAIIIGRKLKTQKFQRHLTKKIIPLIARVLPDADFRIQKSYALVLAISKEVLHIDMLIH